jgi:protein SCO1/2
MRTGRATDAFAPGWYPAILLLLVVLLAACGHSAPPWGLRDISGLMPSLDFTLTAASDGATVHGQDYRGQVVLLYFGYTHCPDVCPTTLSRLSRAVGALGTSARQVRILFVSVDPARDTLAQLKAYAGAFGPEVVGLRGSEAELNALTKRYRVSYGYGKPDSHGNYEVSHSSAVYVFDRDGKIRLLVGSTDSTPVITRDLQRLLAEKRGASASRGRAGSDHNNLLAIVRKTRLTAFYTALEADFGPGIAG